MQETCQYRLKSAAGSTYPLLLDTALFTTGGQVASAMICGANLVPVPPWTPTPTPLTGATK